MQQPPKLSSFADREFMPVKEKKATAFTNPVSQERIQIIDSVRGFAILGILLVHITWFGLPFQYDTNLNLHNEYSGPNYYVWWVINIFFQGSQRAIFSMLFGTSTILLLGKLENKARTLSPADVYYRRLIWLLIFGIVDAYILLWPGDILYAYALCGFFLFPFRNLRPKYLLLCGLTLMLLSGIKTTRDLYHLKSMRVKGENALQLEQKGNRLTDEQSAEKKVWLEYDETFNNTKNLLTQAHNQNLILHKGYSEIFEYYKEVNKGMETVNFYNNIFFDVLAFFFIGMALFKWGILSGERSKRFYWWMLFIGYAVGLFMAYQLNVANIRTKFDDSKLVDIIGFDFYQEKRLFVALGCIGTIMLIYKYGIANNLLKIFARVGQMTLTNYLMQSLICGLFFYGYGLDMFGKLERYQLYYVVLAVWVFEIVFSNIWLKYFHYGPFEWLWRSLTYWKKQPLIKKPEIISHTFPPKQALIP